MASASSSTTNGLLLFGRDLRVRTALRPQVMDLSGAGLDRQHVPAALGHRLENHVQGVLHRITPSHP